MTQEIELSDDETLTVLNVLDHCHSEAIDHDAAIRYHNLRLKIKDQIEDHKNE